MSYITSISIDGKDVTKDLLKHAKLIKIVKSDKLLVDHLYLIINKTDYKGPLPQENSIVEFRRFINCKVKAWIECFYINKEDNIFSSDQLTEREKAIAKEANSIIFYGLSVRPDFINKHNLVDNSTSQPKAYVFKDKTLTEVLEHIKTALGLTKLIITQPLKNTKITYFAPNKVHKRPDDTYTKTPLEQLADIFYAVANIRNNTLYFIKKRYSNKELRHILNLSSEQLKRKECVRGDFVDYNGTDYYYWEQHTPTTIVRKQIGIEPFLKLDNSYEKNLANVYAHSKYDEIKEKEILNLTLTEVHTKLPGYYIHICKSKALGASDKGIADIIGSYSIKECVIIYSGMQQERKQDPNEAGPSRKKAKLEPSWSTFLKLIKVSGN